jgi:NitT/TauT family transport system ATP-binding protein
MRIHAENLSKDYVLDGRTLNVLSGVNVDIADGRFACLLGPSGCGKSTFLRCVAGLETPTAGELKVDDRPVAGPGPDRTMVFQDYALFPWYTVEQNISFGLKLARNKPLAHRVADGSIGQLLKLVGLQGFENAYPHQISGGMRQRVAIARALAVDPGVLLMDEPFAAIDAITRETLQREIVDIWSKTHKTVLFVTHSVAEAVYLGDEVHVFGTRPASIRETLEIDLPRPRDPSSPRFVEAVEYLRNAIDASHAHAGAV